MDRDDLVDGQPLPANSEWILANKERICRMEFKPTLEDCLFSRDVSDLKPTRTRSIMGTLHVACMALSMLDECEHVSAGLYMLPVASTRPLGAAPGGRRGMPEDGTISRQ